MPDIRYEDLLRIAKAIEKVENRPSLRLVESPLLVRQQIRRLPKQRKKRALKKWIEGRMGTKYTYSEPAPYVIQTPMGIIAHPAMAKRLRKLFPTSTSASFLGGGGIEVFNREML